MKLIAVLLFAALPVVQSGGTVESRAGFMAGCWETQRGAQTVREDWRVVTPDFLIGTGTTIVNGAVREFEFQRVELKGGAVTYVAQPNGVPPTLFTLDPASKAGQAIFVNMQHDYPKRVAYEKVGDDAMTAWIDDGAGGKKIEFPYRRCK